MVSPSNLEFEMVVLGQLHRVGSPPGFGLFLAGVDEDVHVVRGRVGFAVGNERFDGPQFVGID